MEALTARINEAEERISDIEDHMMDNLAVIENRRRNKKHPGRTKTKGICKHQTSP